MCDGVVEFDDRVADLIDEVIRPRFLGPIRDFVTGCDVPKPDGVCRLEPECLSGDAHYGLSPQPNIYYSDQQQDFQFKDIDFKGDCVMFYFGCKERL